MKLNPVPTSPKSQKKEKLVQEIYAQTNLESFEKPKKHSRNGFLVVVLSLTSGLMAGFLGALILQALEVINPNLPFFGQLPGFNYTTTSGIIVQRNEGNLKTQEQKIQEMIDQVKKSVVIIFPQKQNLEKTNLLANNYQLSEAKGSGFILTNDGLGVTTSEVIPDDKQEYVVLTADQNLYLLTEIINDPLSRAVFFRLKANNLSVTAFADPLELKIGQRVIALRNKMDGSGEAVFTELRNLHYYLDRQPSDLIYSTESFSDFFLLSSSLPSGFEGTPLITTEGKIIGLVQNNLEKNGVLDLALPISYLKSPLNDILKNGKIERRFLGLHFLDLSRLVNISEDVSGGRKKGVLIYGDNSLDLPAVLKQSPAQKAGLKQGDIIIKVRGTEIDRNHSLTELIQEEEIGKSIELVFLRNGQEQKKEVELTALSLP